jgi:hypothetical protein
LLYIRHETRTCRLVIEPISLILPADGGFHAAFMLRLTSGGDLSPAKVGGNLSNLRLFQADANRVQEYASACSASKTVSLWGWVTPHCVQRCARVDTSQSFADI